MEAGQGRRAPSSPSAGGGEGRSEWGGGGAGAPGTVVVIHTWFWHWACLGEALLLAVRRGEGPSGEAGWGRRSLSCLAIRRRGTGGVWPWPCCPPEGRDGGSSGWRRGGGAEHRRRHPSEKARSGPSGGGGAGAPATVLAVRTWSWQQTMPRSRGLKQRGGVAVWERNGESLRGEAQEGGGDLSQLPRRTGSEVSGGAMEMEVRSEDGALADYSDWWSYGRLHPLPSCVRCKRQHRLKDPAAQRPRVKQAYSGSFGCAQSTPILPSL